MRLHDQLLWFLAANPASTDPIRIMKGLFILSRAVNEGKLPSTETFEFAPMDYGPCSQQVYDCLHELVAQGSVREEPVPGETWKRYSIGDAKLSSQNDEEEKIADYLRKVRSWCDAQSFTSLLKAVYHAYPSFAVNSVLPHLRPNQ
jgi:hypothetical protein